MATQKVRFGTVELTGNFAGKEFNDLPEALEAVYEVEVPSDCEYVVDGEAVNGSDIIADNDSVIEIRAVAGKKA